MNILGKIFRLTHKDKELACGKSVSDDLSLLQKKISYSFKDLSLLKQALTHSSCYRINKGVSMVSPYERMEFLGDSILGLAVSEFLYNTYPDRAEGYLSKLKSQIVSENYLAIKAKELDIGDFIILGDDEFKNSGYEKKSILANVMESLICAIYLDSNYTKAKKFVSHAIVSGYKEELSSSIYINYKSIVQEHYQAIYQKVPTYTVISSEGPAHKKVFIVEISINDEIIGSGTGLNKKEAEQDAARSACIKLDLV